MAGLTKSLSKPAQKPINNLFLDPKSTVGFQKLYVFEDKITSYNLFLGNLQQKVPEGIYLYSKLSQKNGEVIYELTPENISASTLTLLDIHYVYDSDFKWGFQEGHIYFVPEQEET